MLIKSMLTVEKSSYLERATNFCKRRFKLRFLLYVAALIAVCYKIGWFHG